jgi:hypothetical protein
MGSDSGRSRIADPLWLHFRMDIPDWQRGGATEPGDPGCRDAIRTEPPLGWVLSKESRRAIDNMIRCVAHNQGEMEKLVAAMTE